jgi:hypothetical protein
MSSLIEEKYYPAKDYLANIVENFCASCQTKKCQGCIFYFELASARESCMKKTGQKNLS